MEFYSNPPAICRLCLTTGRTMTPVASVLWAYHTVLGVQESHEAKVSRKSHKVCWECRAILNKLQHMKSQASLARELLNSGVRRSLSKLDIFCGVKFNIHKSFIEDDQDCFFSVIEHAGSSGENVKTGRDIIGRTNSEINQDSSIQIGQEFKLEIEPKIEPTDEAEDLWVESVHFDDCKSEPSVKDEVTSSKDNKNSIFKPKATKDKNGGRIKKTNEDKKKESKKRKAPVPKLCGTNCRKRKKRIDVNNKKKFKCEACNLILENDEDRKTHDAEWHPVGALPACTCPKKKKNWRHEAAPFVPIPPRNPDTGTLDCDLCSSKLKTEQYYRRHYRGHIGTQRFQCDICAKVFTLRPQIHSHMKFHFPLTFLCDICGKPEHNKHALKVHMYSHSGLESRPYKCDLCPRKFITMDKLKIHAVYHTGVKDFKCQLCPRAYFVKYELTQHLKKCHSIGESKIDKKPVPRTRSMVRNKPLNTSNARNQRTTGLGKDEWMCNLCGKRFASKTCLDAHKVVHTGDRPYKCTECDQRFKFHSNVLTHLRSMHTVEKIHECPTCGARFKLKGNLTAHMKMHSGDKPFTCDICNQKFIRSRNLRNHYKVHSQGRL